MSEVAPSRGSRWRHFLLMLPFFLIGVAIPVYFYGFSGDGPPQGTPMSDTYSVAPASPDSAPAPDGTYRPNYSPRSGGRGFGVVGFVRRLFEDPVDAFVAPSRSPLAIKLGVVVAIFVVGFIIVRFLISFLTGALGGVGGFLIHKAAGPMFMGFLAVGSTWGIHQTVAEQFGMQWAAATVAITAAVATLFALAGVRVRA